MHMSFRMRYSFKIILTLATLLFACGQKTKPLGDRAIIDLNLIDSVTLERYQGVNDSIPNKSVKLTDLQAEAIVDEWNNSTEKGICKFGVRFQMTVYLTDKKTRHFRINGQT